MNNNRTLYARNAFAAAALTLMGTVAALPAQAQQVSRAQVRADVIAAQANGSLGSVGAQWGVDTTGRPLNSGSTASRAEVRAEARQAVSSGEIDASIGDSYGNAPAQTGSDLTRAEVKAATVQAARDGSLAANIGDSYGTAPIAQRASRRVL
jgi:hypothetical protein